MVRRALAAERGKMTGSAPAGPPLYSQILVVLNVTAESLMATGSLTHPGPLEIGRDLTDVERGHDVRVDHIAL